MSSEGRFTRGREHESGRRSVGTNPSHLLPECSPKETRTEVCSPNSKNLILLVGATGFEPATLCSQSRCATRLRYAPTSESPYSTAFFVGTSIASISVGPPTVAELSQNSPDRRRTPPSFADRFCFCSASLHLQFHLRIAFEHLRVALPEKLRDPLIGYPTGAQSRRVGRAQIVDPKIPDFARRSVAAHVLADRRQFPYTRKPVSVTIRITCLRYTGAAASICGGSDHAM